MSERPADAAYEVDPLRALPATAYRAASLSVELDRVWSSDWVWVGTADQVAEPGDWFATAIGRQPAIVLRDQAGELRALRNLCSHRGTLLVEGDGNTKRFQCPYHAWTFADDGRLLAVPHARPEDVDRAAHCLPVYRVEEWHGLLFASMNPDIDPLAQRLAHLDEVMVTAGIGELHHWTAERETGEWQANWKLVITNAMESYHLFHVHPETLEPYTPTKQAYYVIGGADGTVTGGATSYGPDYVLVSLPPNFVGVLLPDGFNWQAVQPLAHDRTRITVGGAYSSASPSTQSGVSKLLSRAGSEMMRWTVPDFLPEDQWICERGQEAAIGDFAPGSLVPMEQVVIDFHHYLNRQLHGVEPPPVRTGAEVGVPRVEPDE